MLDQRDQRLAAAPGPVEPWAFGLPTTPIWSVVAPKRPRRGEAIWSRIFFRIAPANVGTVAVTRIVP